MCIIAFALNVHPDYPLILIGNRDEFYLRKTAALDYWNDSPDILGGRDLKAGGSWLAASKKTARIAAVTNIRMPEKKPEDALSRGLLVSNYLNCEDSNQFFDSVNKQTYLPFNLLCYEKGHMHYVSNEYPHQILTKGIYAISNGELDNGWPKTQLLKSLFNEQLSNLKPDNLWSILANNEKPNSTNLPDTGVGKTLEKLLSSIFISSTGYGTRSSHLLMLNNNQELYFAEQRFGAFGKKLGLTEHRMPFNT